MTRDEALDKIKKCLALAASPLPHEAAAAMRQAQKLMALFNLNEVDVSLADVSEVSRQAQNTPLVLWETALAAMVGAAFGCDYFTGQRLHLSGSLQTLRRRFYTFVGVGPAPEVAGYAFEVLARQCARDRRRHMAAQPRACKQKTKVARGDMYAEGWVDGVRAKLGRFSGNEQDAALIAEHMARQYPGMKEASAINREKNKNVCTTVFKRWP